MRFHSLTISKFFVTHQSKFKFLPFVGFNFLSLYAFAADKVVATKTKDKSAEEIISQMSLKQKIGQLLILGFKGTYLDKTNTTLLREIQPGALIVFSRNIQSARQLASLTEGAQKLSLKQSSVPLLIMVDQEGGSVSRLKTKPRMPSALAIAKLNDLSFTKKYGAAVGAYLSALGLNMNLAPVADISDPETTNFIGHRAYGGSVETVTPHILAYAEGLSNAGVIPTVKHFPGHGGLTQDSHVRTPQKLMSMEELAARDLDPFKQFAKLNIPSAVMAAHVAFPNIDPSGLPAAFSHDLVSNLLRRDLKYSGLIITDDIEMMGADIAGSITERAIRAIEAGNDMIMVAWSVQKQKQVFNSLVQAVQDGRITESHLNENVLRIVKQKLAVQTLENKTTSSLSHVRNAEEFLKELSSHVLRQTFAMQSENLATQLSENFKGKNVFVFSSEPGFYKNLVHTKKSGFHYVRLTPDSLHSPAHYLQKHHKAYGIYYLTGSVTAKILNALSPQQKSRLLVVNTTYPGLIDDRQQFLGVIDMNTPAPETGYWLGNYLFKNKAELQADQRKPTSRSN